MDCSSRVTQQAQAGAPRARGTSACCAGAADAAGRTEPPNPSLQVARVEPAHQAARTEAVEGGGRRRPLAADVSLRGRAGGASAGWSATTDSSACSGKAERARGPGQAAPRVGFRTQSIALQWASSAEVGTTTRTRPAAAPPPPAARAVRRSSGRSVSVSSTAPMWFTPCGNGGKGHRARRSGGRLLLRASGLATRGAWVARRATWASKPWAVRSNGGAKTPGARRADAHHEGARASRRAAVAQQALRAACSSHRRRQRECSSR